MSASIDQLLLQHFGHQSLRAGQDEVISRVLAGVNTLAILPTGGGKSLCYQLPALALDGLCVVVSPLIALMRDQVDGLITKGISARRLDSTSTEEECEETLAEIERGEVKLLYLSPERMADPVLLKILKNQHISIAAIDEAHCISEWGHSFRPSYIRLPKLIRKLKPSVILALTATASTKTATGIAKAFSILKRDQVRTSFYRENLSFDVTVAAPAEKKQKLLESLQQAGRLPAIIYATRRADVEEVAAYLSSEGIMARAYHAGMPAVARAEVQDGFLAHEIPVICATIAFGMGVDMPDVRSVIHYHPPKSPEGWIQESGRAGRDGKASHCEVLICSEDRTALESMVMAKQPASRPIEAVLQNIFSQGKQAIVSSYTLSTRNDIPAELLEVMLARLETDGWIALSGASWMWCHVVPLCWDPSAKARILEGFTKKEQQVLSELIDAKSRVSLLELVDGSITKLSKLITLLRELEAAGDVKLKLSHSLKHYKILKTPESIPALSSEVMTVFEQHAQHDMDRIDAVFKWALSKRCLASSLVGYFGEKLAEPCGHCASCVGKYRPRKLPLPDVEEVSLEEMEKVQEVIAERRAALSSPARLARFLCGIYSPAMSLYRLYQRPQWGMLARLPYDDVLSLTKAML